MDLVASGEEVTLTKRGREVVKLVPSDPPRRRMPSLAEHRANMTFQTEAAGEFIRKLRESKRY